MASALSGDPALSARLKALPREVECVAQLASRFVRNAFKLHAGMEFIRTVALGQLLAMITSVLALAESISARRSPSVSCRGSAHCLRAASKTAPVQRSSWSLRDEMLGGVRRRPRDVCPNVLLRLFFELNESAHGSAVSHRTGPVVTRTSSSSLQ